MNLKEKFAALHDTIQPGKSENSASRPLEDAVPTAMDPVLKRHLGNLEHTLASSEGGEVLTEFNAIIPSVIAGGALAGAIGVAAKQAVSGWLQRWYKNKTRLIKDFSPDDFERLFEERIKPMLVNFIEEVLMEKLTKNMPPEWWVSFSRRHSIKRRVSEKLGMMISRELAKPLTSSLSDTFNKNLDMMEKELKLMIMRQGERPAGKPKMSGWGAAKEKGKEKESEKEE